MNADPVTEKMVSFIREIGIEVEFVTIPGVTFVPGITICEGRILVDAEKLLYPGDLLHEAGHIAVLLPDERNKEQLTADESLGNEIAAIIWSYAACYHLKIDPAVVFHDAGYKGQSDWYIENFTSGNYIGLHLLQWMGFCADAVKAKEQNIAPFPAMKHWLRKA